MFYDSIFSGFAQQKVFFMVFYQWQSIVFGCSEIRPTPLIPACKCLAILQGVGVQGAVCWMWGVICGMRGMVCWSRGVKCLV